MNPRVALALACAGVASLSLSACGAGSSADTAGSSPDAPNTAARTIDGATQASANDPKAELSKAAQEYADAFTTGDPITAAAFLAPSCTDEERGEVARAVSMFKDMAKGSRMVVNDVSLAGDSGEVSGYSWQGEPKEALRRTMEDPGRPVEKWKRLAGKWYRADC